uniref:Uncharacterized protein n=1 Tax=Ditylenchus dipsaci TaxID=166011 RepID=A0A915DVI3_9BILA
MESNGIPGRIHLNRGNIEIIVGSGIHYTYFLERNNKKVWELCGREPEQQHSANGYAELHAATHTSNKLKWWSQKNCLRNNYNYRINR